MKIERKYTTDKKPVAEQITWKIVSAKIDNSDFEMKNIEVPAHWSQRATNIIAQKYFRKAGIAQFRTAQPDESVPAFLWPMRLSEDTSVVQTFSGETSAKQVFHRLAGHWTYIGWKHGYFKASENSARAFYDEIYYMLAMQIAAPNSPQWFNTGLWWAYGIDGPDSGQWAVDYSRPFDDSNFFFQPGNSYEYPQPHACFIQPIDDDLVNPGGIMDLWTREVRLFKHGSGTGTNFSNIRSLNESLSGGGKSSGLMSFLEIGDRAAGAIKSGGTTRRAAKMVCLDLDHPEIEDFINWKVREEAKAAAMYVGGKVIRDYYLGNGDSDSDPLSAVPQAVKDRANNGFEPEIFPCSWEGEAIRTVSGQNSNNSVRVPDNFLVAVDNNNAWRLKERTTGKYVKEISARDLWSQICRAAWASADPGVQFDDTINDWNTCSNDGRINASNPCGEYNFLDNTACNLASLNLCQFLQYDYDSPVSKGFDVDSFVHACRLWTIVLDISVTMASFPSREIAEGSWKYRTLGLGYANAGGLLMRQGLAYDSDEGRVLIAALTALMHGVSYKTSAKLASELGAFPRYEANKEPMQKVIRKHNASMGELARKMLSPIIDRALDIWGWLTEEDRSYRNAQTTLIAPTGTIALLMDCDTTGIEPDFALRKTKSLAGGGTMDFINEAVSEALTNLGYNTRSRNLILEYVKKNGTVEGNEIIKSEHLAIFDCAVPASGFSRCLSSMAHVEMVAAVQPFLSGAASKTVNLPHNATIEDIDQIYRSAHKLGIKSIALYRDGSKLTQPLNVEKQKTEVNWDKKFEEAGIKMQKVNTPTVEEILNDKFIDTTTEETNHLVRGERESLLSRRRGYTQKFKVDGQSMFLTTGEYEDGRLGEIFVTLAKQGSAARGYMDALAMAVSIGLQHGVPLEKFVNAFTYTKFEPAGIVQGHDRIKICSSLIDLIFRDLGITYLGQDDLANVTPEEPTEQHEESATNWTIMNWTIDEVAPIAEEVWNKVKTRIPSGELCPTCGGAMIQTGTCKMCSSCGTSNGGCG